MGDYISEDTASDFDSSSNMSDSSVSEVSSGNMIIPYDSVILEYIFLSDEARDFIRNECCEYSKVEVKKEILNFIDQPHRVYVRSKAQERGKELRQLLKKFKEVVDTKRYEKWKVLHTLFIEYFAI